MSTSRHVMTWHSVTRHVNSVYNLPYIAFSCYDVLIQWTQGHILPYLKFVMYYHILKWCATHIGLSFLAMSMKCDLKWHDVGPISCHAVAFHVVSWHSVTWYVNVIFLLCLVIYGPIRFMSQSTHVTKWHEKMTCFVMSLVRHNNSSSDRLFWLNFQHLNPQSLQAYIKLQC